MNAFYLSGRITKDIELQTTQQGTQWCSGSVAVERDYKDKDGNKGTDFITIKAFGSQANFLAMYCLKGSLVEIVCGVTNANYEKDGKKVYHDDYVVRSVKLLVGVKKEEQATGQPVSQPKEKVKTTPLTTEDISDEDLPF